MTEEEKKKRQEEERLEEERRARRLVIGAGIVTSFASLMGIRARMQKATLPPCLPQYNCGYWNHANGTFSPSPV